MGSINRRVKRPMSSLPFMSHDSGNWRILLVITDEFVFAPEILQMDCSILFIQSVFAAVVREHPSFSDRRHRKVAAAQSQGRGRSGSCSQFGEIGLPAGILLLWEEGCPKRCLLGGGSDPSGWKLIFLRRKVIFSPLCEG